MTATVEILRRSSRSRAGIPPLENGARLASHEFLRRYEAMPELRKAELIKGIVYMPSAVSAEHGKQDSIMQAWLCTYAVNTPGVESFTNTTIVLGPSNTPQPDACLCIKPDRGGQTRINEKNYLVG